MSKVAQGEFVTLPTKKVAKAARDAAAFRREKMDRTSISHFAHSPEVERLDALATLAEHQQESVESMTISVSDYELIEPHSDK